MYEIMREDRYRRELPMALKDTPVRVSDVSQLGISRRAEKRRVLSRHKEVRSSLVTRMTSTICCDSQGWPDAAKDRLRCLTCLVEW